MLALAGCDVAIIDVDAVAAANTATLVRGAGRTAVELIGDALDSAALEALMERAAAELGRPFDVLVTVIGQAEWVGALDVSRTQWDLEQHRNLFYVLVATQLFAKANRKSGGWGKRVSGRVEPGGGRVIQKK